MVDGFPWDTRSRPGNLAAETSSFVGRAREIEAVKALLAQERLVTLTGVAGVGKTRLALKVARRLSRAFPDGVWVAELSAEQNPGLVAHDVAAALGMVEQSARPEAEVLAEHLAGKKALIVLDTCEHLIDACRDLAERVLRQAPEVRLLATSRQALGVPGERVVVVGPLPVPRSGSFSPDDYCSVRLFLDRALALVPDLDPDLEAVGRLCRRLDGIPLAIELAARRVRTLSVEQIADRLDDRFALLTSGSRTPLGRHQTLRTAVGWSHELLGARERLLWARLTVFAGSFDAATAQAVCADAQLPEIRPPLDRLVHKSIVTEEGGRHRMLGMIREYGMEWLRRLGEDSRLARRHREHYLFLAQRADEEWYGPAQAEWADWAHTELPNLRAALDDGLAEPAGLELAGTLWFVWVCLGHTREGRYYLDKVLEAHPMAGPARTKALWAAAWVAGAQGDLRTAERRAREAQAEARRRGDDTAAGYATYVLGAMRLLRGDLRQADTLTRQAVDHFQRADRPEIGLPVAEAARALLHNLRGEYEQALAVLKPQRERCTARGEMWALSYGDHMRSQAELALGEVQAADASAREALDAKWRLGDAAGSAMVLDQLAATAVARHDPECAAYLLGTARRLWNTIGLPQFGSAGLAVARADTERRAREVLGDAAYEAAYAVGLTVEPQSSIDRIRARKPQ
ncbi:putative ATPase [Thermocatellispora tengchongensis]|uniref:Putative ATPase n=1 Tax=Thermocatellispora tengchongensis TaxID=1073253 RepID=A0A840PBB7_9ACTN|nr:AAA family ATPase [Thermocatellispora tengchongensis]MBB5138694.1 putative ATPase [Thermocatellispora tengchongensis]